VRHTPDIRPLLRGLRAVQRELDDIRTEATSRDRLVTVTVDGRGRLLELEIDRSVFRSPNSRALADAVLDAVRRATDQAAEEAARRLLKECS
jgi:DNA-binding protein YbaB